MESGSRIEVRCYEGSRANETPRVLVIDGAEVAIRTIIDRWIEEGLDRQDRKRCFKIIGDDSLLYTIHCDYASGGWYLDKAEIIA